MNYIDGLQHIEPITMKKNELPLYHQSSAHCAFVRFGGVAVSNNPYFGTQEKKCSGQICRVVTPKNTIDDALVIDEHGYEWSVHFSNFADWKPVKVVK